jgi:hypothetical protein
VSAKRDKQVETTVDTGFSAESTTSAVNEKLTNILLTVIKISDEFAGLDRLTDGD